SLVLSTKKLLWENITPDEVRKGLEQSLKQLGTDYVDIYHLHGVKAAQYDYLVSVIVPFLEKARQDGKIRFIGITENFTMDPQHAMLRRAVLDDCWDVMMVGFNILNQSARDRVFPGAISKNIGVLNSYAVRLGLTRKERLHQLIQELVLKGQLDAAAINMEDPLGFLLRQGGAMNTTEAGYRFCREEPGVHVVLSGTGNPAHLQQNIETFSSPPLPEKDVERLKLLFRNADCVSGQ
ncbi:MAG: aldo/keto reductase, partial [Chloroflexi bacterium]|nr:aldo/keto reductase [Chloroflexota bacterium]